MTFRRIIKILIVTFSLILILISLFFLFRVFNWFDKEITEPVIKEVGSDNSSEDKEELIEEDVLSEEKVNELKEYEIVLNNNLKQYKTSVIYYDLKYDYVYKYQEDILYNSASLIKILDALYIYNQNSLGQLDLYTTVKYESKYRMTYSYGMKQEKLGTDISILQLIDYALGLSDNTAHAMLIDYIGRITLSNYAKSLGLKKAINESGQTMILDADDALILLQELYLIFNDHEYGEHLKAVMINNHHNYFFGETDNTKNVCKYGHIEGFYHNIGVIYEDDNPYLIVILTKHDKSFETIINNISQEIYTFHKLVHQKNNQS